MKKRVSFIMIMGTLFFVGLVYCLTLAPTVVQIDSGELAAVQCLMGIAHPTGYPLFTLLGHLFVQIPIVSLKILQLNFLALLWCVLGIGFFTQSLRLILKEMHQKKLMDTRFDFSSILLMTGMGGGFFLAFSKTVWMLSTSIEVYSLHFLLMNFILLSAVRAYFHETDSIKPWIWTAFTLALGFSNHMTTLLILPGLAILYFQKSGFSKASWKRIGILSGFFLIILILNYLYLPIRASSHPVLNWGDPVRLDRLMRHITGRQYQVWFFSSSKAAFNHLLDYLKHLPGEFAWPGFILSFIGLIFSFKIHRRLAVFLSVTFVVTVLYAIQYDIHDLDTYFLLSYMVMAIWIAIGIFTLFSSLKKLPVWSAGLILLVCIGIEIRIHYQDVNQKDMYLYEDYTKQALAALPENSLILSYQWDYLVSPSYYFQYVEHFREDVIIIDKELLRRSWYFTQLERQYPDIMNRMKDETGPFLKALEPFEKGGDYNSRLLESLYQRLFAGFIETHIHDRPVFIAPELVENELSGRLLYLPPGLTLVPDLFFFRVVKSDDYIPADDAPIRIRFPKKEDKYVLGLKSILYRMWVRRALYEKQHQKTGGLKRMTDLIRAHFPVTPLPSQLKQ